MFIAPSGTSPPSLLVALLVQARFRVLDPEPGSGDQLKPKPVPLGLCVARMGSVMPLPSGPRPMPGLQPMLCSMRLPMFVSGMGGAFSPTNPEKRGHGLEKSER